jgi:3-phosphoglycerate kinase
MTINTKTLLIIGGIVAIGFIAYRKYMIQNEVIEDADGKKCKRKEMGFENKKDPQKPNTYISVAKCK